MFIFINLGDSLLFLPFRSHQNREYYLKLISKYVFWVNSEEPND